MCAAQDKFDEFLGRMKLLSLGVLRNNLPYCCSAFYAYDPQNKELIIASASDSERFPFARAMETDFFTIRIDWMKMTDNTLTFGKKLIWER